MRNNREYTHLHKELHYTKPLKLISEYVIDLKSKRELALFQAKSGEYVILDKERIARDTDPLGVISYEVTDNWLKPEIQRRQAVDTKTIVDRFRKRWDRNGVLDCDFVKMIAEIASHIYVGNIVVCPTCFGAGMAKLPSNHFGVYHNAPCEDCGGVGLRAPEDEAQSFIGGMI